MVKNKSEESKTIDFIKLIDDTKIEIKYIYHLSDIHIRKNERHDEYKEIFNKVYKILENNIDDKKNSLIIITGDIMHMKTDLSPELIRITSDLFKSLSKITNVIIIPGNHDCNLSNKNKLDALSPIIENIGTMNNLFYLKKSGFYQYYNIIFAITSIFDDIIIPSDKINKDIWNNIQQKNKYKISLYHGPVHGAKTDVGYRMNTNDLVVDDFKGYDYVMLGDIHKYQYLNKEKTIAYAGSLIQQSYGESLKNHGVIKWDLKNRKSQFIEIDNDYGFCTIYVKNGKMEETNIPPKPRIRFILENTNQLQLNDIVKKLNKYEIQEIIKDSTFKTNIILDSKNKENKKISILQEDTIKNFLLNKKYNKETINMIMNLHKRIISEKEYKTIKIKEKDQNKNWNILELKFSNMLSYGEDNIIDFRKFEKNKIIGIMAPNHYGKSAILDIILFCLFDKFTRGQRRDILNKNKNNLYCSLLFNIGDRKYLIERSGHRSKSGLEVKISVNFYEIKLNNGQEEMENLNGDTVLETNNKIIELIGDYNDYLITSFSLQQNQENFTDMTKINKKKYLHDILKLNLFEDCCRISKEKSKELDSQLKLLEKKLEIKSFNSIKEINKKLTIEIKNYEKQKNIMVNDYLQIINYILDKIPRKPLIKFGELDKYNVDDEENILHSINIINNELIEHKHHDISYINNEIKCLKNKMQILESEENNLNENNKFKSLMSQKEELIKKIITIPKNIIEIDYNKCIQDKIELDNSIINLDNLLNKYKNNIIVNKFKYINKLKANIRKYHRLLIPLTSNVENINLDSSDDIICYLNSKLQELNNKYRNLQEKISLQMDNELNKNILNYIEKNNVKNVINLKKSIIEHLDRNLKELNKYKNGIDKDNDNIINKIKRNDNKLYNKYRKWIALMDIKLEHIDENNICKLFNESNDILKNIIEVSSDILNEKYNDNIRKKITKNEGELNNLENIINTKNEFDSLEKEKSLLNDKRMIIMDKIKQMDEYNIIIKENNMVENKINELEKEIKIYETTFNRIKHESNTIKLQIIKHEEDLKKYEKMNCDNKKLNNHLYLLNKYHLNFINWSYDNEMYNKWEKIKNELNDKINDINKMIEIKKIELASGIKDMEYYLQMRKEFDDKINENNVYQLYIKMMDYDGLPYEILKTYLPIIAADINQILHSIVNFDIEFMFYDEKLLKEQKEKQLKMNYGCIDINICRKDSKPYNIDLASGFEKFIINLAIRMVLCKISLTTKPNFLIIDEGWSCLDNENLVNISYILDYIKIQYDYIIMISHIDELKDQTDYIINIDKYQGYSYVNTTNELYSTNKLRNNKKSK